MKIVAENNRINVSNFVEVKSAKYVEDYKINIKFDNGLEQLIDFRAFLEKSLHPSIKKYLNVSFFKQFKIIDGNLNWNDYDMIFPINDLLEGKI